MHRIKGSALEILVAMASVSDEDEDVAVTCNIQVNGTLMKVSATDMATTLKSIAEQQITSHVAAGHDPDKPVGTITWYPSYKLDVTVQLEWSAE